MLHLLLGLPGVDVNIVDKGYSTALHLVNHRQAPRCTQCVAELLNFKADPFIATQRRSASRGDLPPACFSCIGFKARTICRYLRRHDADRYLLDKGDITPLELARQMGCSGCVRAIEEKVKLWQGWVDVFEWRFKLVPRWTPKWLVVLQDARPNTGSNAERSQVRCSRCDTVQQAPPLVPRFLCSCGAHLAVSTSVQLAIYENSRQSTASVVPDTARPVVVQPLPQSPALIHTHVIEERIVESLAECDLTHAVRASLRSERRFGLACSILSRATGRVEAEYCFRVVTDADRKHLQKIFSNPVAAAYWACNPPPLTRPCLLGGPWAEKATEASARAALGDADREDSNSEQPATPRQCVICLDRPADSAIVPCGHMCGCYACLQALHASETPQCPLCRTPVTSVIRIFLN